MNATPIPVRFRREKNRENAQNAQLTSWKIPTLLKISCISSQNNQQLEVQPIKMPPVVWVCLPLRAS
jgi:hypothetical protein